MHAFIRVSLMWAAISMFCVVLSYLLIFMFLCTFSGKLNGELIDVADVSPSVDFEKRCIDDVGCFVGVEAEDLIRQCLSVDQSHRPTLSEVLDHPWMQCCRTVVIADEDDDVKSSLMLDSSQS